MIHKLILKNSIPLSKKGVTHVELNTKDIFNIILGRNGFGKTSLLKQLTPFPADNADFLPGGYKETHHVVGKDTYILKSMTGKGSEHHFIKNGKELNEGNTLLVQRELVKIHFGITQNIKNVLTGLDVRDLFTTLSAPRRKDILMAINPNDTSYAIKKYDKLKSNHNALKGGLKTQRQRLAVEEGRLSQLINLDAEKLNNEIKIMDNQIKNALIIHGELQHIEHKSIAPLKDEIGNIISFLIGSNSVIKFPKSTLLQIKENYYTNYDYYKTKEIKYSTMLTEFSDRLSGLDINNSNLESYHHRLSNINKAREEHHNNLNKLNMRFNNNPEFAVTPDGDGGVFETFCLLAHNFVYQIQSVNKAVDLEITSAKYQKVTELLQQTTNEREHRKREMEQINHTLHHYNRAESVDCPKCDAKFKPGLTDIDPDRLNNKLADLKTRYDELDRQVISHTDYIEDNQGWYNSMMDMLRFARSTDIPDTLIKMIQVYQIGKKDTSVLVSLVKSTKQYTDLVNTLKQLDEEKETVEKQILFLESSDIETLFKRAEYVERELGSIQHAASRILRDIKDIDNQLDIIEMDVQKRDRLGILMDELKQTLGKNGQYKVKLKIEDVINELTPRKEQLITNLIRSESLNSVIQSIKDNIADLEKREKHTALLLEGLSPTNGLIGFLMNDFIKSVVANVNAIIQPIWTSRLSVLNCSTSKNDDDVELNYTFPVFTGDNDTPNKDIGDCSGGEREIINFAFRLVLLRYLAGKSSLPLMMDEIGVAFDELHKGRFFAYIAEQMRLDKLPQVFLISHNYKEYASNINTNVIALNTEGLRIGLEVNKNSVIR